MSPKVDIDLSRVMPFDIKSYPKLTPEKPIFQGYTDSLYKIVEVGKIEILKVLKAFSVALCFVNHCFDTKSK